MLNRYKYLLFFIIAFYSSAIFGIQITLYNKTGYPTISARIRENLEQKEAGIIQGNKVITKVGTEINIPDEILNKSYNTHLRVTIIGPFNKELLKYELKRDKIKNYKEFDIVGGPRMVETIEPLRLKETTERPKEELRYVDI